MTLMMWEGLRRLKSLSLTKLTAGGAVVGSVPLRRPKASRWVWLKELGGGALAGALGACKRGVVDVMVDWCFDVCRRGKQVSKIEGVKKSKGGRGFLFSIKR